jgi:hypothetical protein
MPLLSHSGLEASLHIHAEEMKKNEHAARGSSCSLVALPAAHLNDGTKHGMEHFQLQPSALRLKPATVAERLK